VKYLLDTHVIWAHSTDMVKGLPSKVWDALDVNVTKDIFFLDASLYELARHFASGRIVVAEPLEALKLLENNYALIHSNAEIAWTAASLNWQKRNGKCEHLDPADRAIMATAKILNLNLVTADEEMTAFAPTVGVKVFW